MAPTSIRPERPYPSKPLKDFGYRPNIGWDDALYHGADRYSIYSCSANFEIFHDRLFSMSEGRRYQSNSIRISSISLKFDEMMHSTMEHIAVQSGHAPPTFACFVEILDFPW